MSHKKYNNITVAKAIIEKIKDEEIIRNTVYKE